MIKISNLSKKYDNNYVLKDINLEIENGSIYGLLGPNGAGKTTLISALIGLIPCDNGEITIYDRHIKEDLVYIRSISSIVPQNLAFYPTLTAKENLEFFGGMIGLTGNSLKSRIEFVVNKTKLNEVYHQESRTYSGGLKRRLNIAIGLLSNPKVIYFDEPTVGIDPQSRHFILETIKEMKQDNRIIIYTSHYMEEVEFLCDKIAIIDQGKVIKQGDLTSILSGFKANIETKTGTIEIELKDLSMKIDELLANDVSIQSIEYGHNLKNYFLQMTTKKVRD